MTHLINRLQFELNCTDEDQAFNFRQNFGVTFQKQISEIADKICSKYVGEEEWLRIDKLEINLGRFFPASFDRDFVIIFQTKFEKELIEKLSSVSASHRKASVSISKTQLLKHFLQKGNLPWWADEQDININEIVLELIANQQYTIRGFLYHHQTNKNLWTRIAFQLNSEVKTLLILLIEELKTGRELFLKWIEQLSILFKNEAAPEMNVIQNMIDDIILKNAPGVFQNIDNQNILLEIFERNIAEISINKTSRINKIIADNQSGFIQTTYETINAAKEDITSVTNVDLPAAQAEEEEIATEKYIVKHAGIILLSPFLKSFFTNLQLLDGREWKNKNAQYKAVHLLKFLSTGEQETYEYNLTLEKIMCGLNIEEPIPLEILLEENETNEAIQLLESVIEHWKALKNTSVNGLRESFLKRDGILTQKENGWLLQVERKTLDVLIDSIPWGYSTIAFSWNEDLIFVEW